MDAMLAHLVEVWTGAYERNCDELNDLWRSADANGDGMLNYVEFAAMVKAQNATITERQVRSIFRETKSMTD